MVWSESVQAECCLCTFRPVGGLPEQVDLLDGQGLLGGAGATHTHQQLLQALQNLLRKLVLLGGSIIQLFQLG